MLDFVQQLVSGIALGCVYGLIALGFVLVYKATEVVNFAQGDLMMLGGFFAFTFIGMPVKRVVSIVWAISAAVATCAGVLLAPITFIHSNVGLVLGLKAFPAAVLGGFGSIPGAVVGGVLIGVIESMAGFYLPQGWKDVAPYIVLLVVLLLKPEGLFGIHMRTKV